MREPLLYIFDDQDMTLGILSDHTLLVPIINVLGVLQAMSLTFYARGLDPQQLALAEIIQGRLDTTTLARDVQNTSA